MPELVGLLPAHAEMERRYLMLLYAHRAARCWSRKPAAVKRFAVQDSTEPATAWKPRRHFSREVVCVETGRRFPSIKAAAESIRASHTAVSQALRERYRCGGFHWRYADDEAPFVPARKHTRPVRCVETGRSYPGVRAAARVLGISYTSLYRGVVRGYRCRGMRWEFVGPEQAVAA